MSSVSKKEILSSKCKLDIYLFIYFKEIIEFHKLRQSLQAILEVILKLEHKDQDGPVSQTQMIQGTYLKNSL